MSDKWQTSLQIVVSKKYIQVLMLILDAVVLFRELLCSPGWQETIVCLALLVYQAYLLSKLEFRDSPDWYKWLNRGIDIVAVAAIVFPYRRFQLPSPYDYDIDLLVVFLYVRIICATVSALLYAKPYCPDDISEQ